MVTYANSELPVSDTEFDLDRRTVLKAAAAALAVGAASEVPALIQSTPTATFALGSFVVDTEAATQSPAVVLLTPEIPIADWTINGRGSGVTVADQNPGYDPNEPVVIVSYGSHLTKKWEAWKTTDPKALFDNACAHGVKFYAFPASRLAAV